MANIATEERLQQTLSMALEERSSEYQDLVTNANVIFYEMKNRGMMQSYSGPRIREHLVFTQTGTFTRYSGADYLAVTRTNILNDAEFVPKLMAVSVVLTMEEILNNQGENQILPLMATYMDVAKGELRDRFTEDLHDSGTATDQIGGLQLAIPTDPTTGTYGSISRASNAIWRTKEFDINSDFASVTTQTDFNATGAQSMLRYATVKASRGKKGPNMWVMSEDHFHAYSASMEAIQRINDENGLGKQGFTNLKFYGVGKSIDCVLEGGIGTAMPAGISYGIDSDGLKYRYNPARHFKPFGGKQTPINQDMVVQHIGSMGNLTLCNPLHMVKLHDSA